VGLGADERLYDETTHSDRPRLNRVWAEGARRWLRGGLRGGREADADGTWASLAEEVEGMLKTLSERHAPGFVEALPTDRRGPRARLTKVLAFFEGDARRQLQAGVRLHVFLHPDGEVPSELLEPFRAAVLGASLIDLAGSQAAPDELTRVKARWVWQVYFLVEVAPEDPQVAMAVNTAIAGMRQSRYIQERLVPVLTHYAETARPEDARAVRLQLIETLARAGQHRGRGGRPGANAEERQRACLEWAARVLPTLERPHQDRARVWASVALARRGLGDLEGALVAARSSVSSEETTLVRGDHQEILGDVADALGHREEALGAYRRCVLDNTVYRAVLGRVAGARAWALSAELGLLDGPELREMVDALLRLNDQLFSWWARSALLRWRAGDETAARSELAKALTVRPVVGVDEVGEKFHEAWTSRLRRLEQAGLDLAGLNAYVGALAEAEAERWAEQVR
jgi:tetratricopeptide (TPR) repeat protein